MVTLLLIVYMLQGAVHPRWALLPLLVPTVLLVGLLGLAMGILVSSATTKYRDLLHLVGFGVQLWMYMSPVIYPLSQFSGTRLYGLLLVNPMTAPMELFRLAILGVGTVRPVSVCSTLAFTGVMVPLSVVVFNRIQKNFLDTI